jgi:hypothetical protein
LEAEREAAYMAKNQQIGEPTESVLFRSSASLAFGLKDLREAERLICMGLAGNPPSDIACELRELLFSARFCLKKIICLKMKYIQFPKRAFWDTPFRCEG